MGVLSHEAEEAYSKSKIVFPVLLLILCYLLWYDATFFDMMFHSLIYNDTFCDVTLPSLIWCYLLWYDATFFHSALPSLIWCYLFWYDATFFHTTLPSFIWRYLFQMTLPSLIWLYCVENRVTSVIPIEKVFW